VRRIGHRLVPLVPVLAGPLPLQGTHPDPDTGAMFARYFVELPMHPERVEAALLRDPGAWMPGLAGSANHHGDALLAEVGFGSDVRVARTVTVELGRPLTMPTKTVLPLRWTATGVSGVFPSLDADLEIAPLGPDQTQLAMSARYVPPLGALGRVIDRAVLFRVAEATLKDFLDRVRESLLAGVGELPRSG
jgi:hypothetical protein